MRSVLISLLALVLAGPAAAQPATRSEPIVLEWADSLVGSGPTASGLREFIGNVRFRQGNVTVLCDRAIQNQSANYVDLQGHVVVTQDSLRLLAPRASYNGNSKVARGVGGVTVIDRHRTLTARQGTYNTTTKVARFKDSVKAVTDTLTLWSDAAVYFEETGVSEASGRVVAYDTVRRAVLRGDSLFHDPRVDYVKVMGDAAVWQWDSVAAGDTTPAEIDTLYLIADTIEVLHEPEERYIAVGAVELTRGSVAARADSVDHRSANGTFTFFRDPVVWADSVQLTGDTIIIRAPNRDLESIRGLGTAMMVSRSDTLRPDRFDQVAGRVVTMYVQQDTVRSLTSVDDAQSITWRVEDGSPEGLAQFASDTIKVFFEDGTVVDVFWLSDVVGEYPPEKVVAGRETTYRLRGFSWREDRPLQPPTPSPFEPAPSRTPLPASKGEQVPPKTSKKAE